MNGIQMLFKISLNDMKRTMTQAKTLNIQIKWYLRFHDMAHDI
jgi:hypothetical protein